MTNTNANHIIHEITITYHSYRVKRPLRAKAHFASHPCKFCKGSEHKHCGTPAGHPGEHICAVNAHLCGEPCKLSGKRGCLEGCTKVSGHVEDEHLCSAPLHMCGEPCALKGMKLPGGKTYSCPEKCSIPNDHDHETHACDTRLCPARCELCKRLCVEAHLHGLTPDPNVHHLCGEGHPCLARCSAPGICQIDTSPMSIEATFTGRHETFQYTKYTQVANQLPCVKILRPGRTSHTGAHIHSKEDRPFHFCKTRCDSCGYFCTLPLGHAQQEHETSHGSMMRTHWAVEGDDGTSLELGGHRFSSNDEGGPMMCNLVCSSMGRHVHIDYCRAEEKTHCEGDDVQHIDLQMTPNPDKPTDAITHSLYWRRLGFKDPYSREEQANFTKCDAMCPGPEHSGTADTPGQASYCTLPMFHRPANIYEPSEVVGYTSRDGHIFECRNPLELQQAFHVIFVIDRSGSMADIDCQPLADAPLADLIRQHVDNRLGAVYSALYSFWSARHAAVTAGRREASARRDAYSIVLFDDQAKGVLVNEFMRTPEQLLDTVLTTQPSSGTNFTEALGAACTIMEQNWDTERVPIMIFLSDGECSVPDETIQDVCHSAVRRGTPLSFQTVSFGTESEAYTLRRMAQLALEIQNNAPHDRSHPAATVIPSSFTFAPDTILLSETFLGFAESLRKPRGSLMR